MRLLQTRNGRLYVDRNMNSKMREEILTDCIKLSRLKGAGKRAGENDAGGGEAAIYTKTFRRPEHKNRCTGV